MAHSTVVFIHSLTHPYKLLETVITDDNDHPGIAVLDRPECKPERYPPGTCAAVTMAHADYLKLTIPVESDLTLAEKISANVATKPAP